MRRVKLVVGLLVVALVSLSIPLSVQAGWRTNSWNYSASDLGDKDCVQSQLDYISTNMVRSAQGYDGLKVFISSAITNDQQITVTGLSSILAVSASYRGSVVATNALVVKSITGATNVVVGASALSQTNNIFVTIFGL